MFDVIVSGAGPAGAVAATVLARGGARVLLLDRDRFPRPKLCGDTLNPGSLAILRRLGLASDIEPRGLRIDGMLVTGHDGVAVRGAYREGAHGLAITRHTLDHAILRAAVASGVLLEEQVLVRGPLVDGDGGRTRVCGVVIAGADGRDVRIPAPFVIAADGRRSRLALALRLIRHPVRPRRWAVGAYFDQVDAVSTFGEMHVRGGRYIGVAPVPGGLVNVCVVVPAGERLDDPGAVLRAALAADVTLQARFAGARMMTAPVSMGPLAVDARAAGVPGLLLAGDAAGFIDPMTGDGLRFAIRGAELAAAVTLATLARQVAEPHERLARLRRQEFAGKWRFNRVLRTLVGSTFAVRVAGRAAVVAPWALRRTIAFAGDAGRA